MCNIFAWDFLSREQDTKIFLFSNLIKEFFICSYYVIRKRRRKGEQRRSSRRRSFEELVNENKQQLLSDRDAMDRRIEKRIEKRYEMKLFKQAE